MNRKVLAILVAAMMAMLIFAGCKKDDKKPVENKTETTDNKDEKKDEKKDESKDDKKDEENKDTADEKIDDDQYLNTFAGAWFTTLDPDTGSDMYGNDVLINVLEPLLRTGEDESGKPQIVEAGAEKYEVSDDKLTYTFHIRDNKWNDGTPVTAKDYAFGIRRAADPKTASEYANLIWMVKNGQKVNSGEMKLEELGVETPDDKTLVIHLEKPCAYFLQVVQQRVFFPVREDYVQKYGDQYCSDIDKLPMCGPFLVKDWTINSEINYVKNDNYWNKDSVKLQRIHVSILKDADTINNALATGELDLAGVSDPKWQQQFIDNDEYVRFQRVNPWTGYFMMNFGKSSNVANYKITRAIGAVLNRDEVIQNAWDGLPVPAWSFVPPTIECDGLAFNTQDNGPAKKLMEDVKDPKALFEEGCKELGKDPKTVTVRLLGSDSSAKGRIAIEAFQQQIEKALGCKVQATNEDWNAFMNHLKAGEFDIAWLAWGADFNDPSNFLETAYSKTNPYPSGYKDEKFDELIEKAQDEIDPAKRAEILHEAEKILVYDDAAIIPINHSVTNRFSRSYLKGLAKSYFNNLGFAPLYTAGRE